MNNLYRMRILVLTCIFFSITFVSLKAQTPSASDGINYTPISSFPQYEHFGDSSHLNRKWSISKYSGISTGFTFFNGGSATYLSAPIGLRLNRRLNNNLYAFAGISAAPTYINFNHSFSNTGFNKNYPGNNLSSSGNFGIYPRAEMGLMYINDQKTFSISGSIGIERSSYPMYPSNRIQHQQPVIHSRQ